jgi:hypothetical protein
MRAGPYGRRVAGPFGSLQVEGGVPHTVVRVETLDFVQLDVGVLGPVHGSASNPPLGTGQACRQVCASPGQRHTTASEPPGASAPATRWPGETRSLRGTGNCEAYRTETT